MTATYKHEIIAQLEQFIYDIETVDDRQLDILIPKIKAYIQSENALKSEYVKRLKEFESAKNTSDSKKATRVVFKNAVKIAQSKGYKKHGYNIFTYRNVPRGFFIEHFMLTVGEIKDFEGNNDLFGVFALLPNRFTGVLNSYHEYIMCALKQHLDEVSDAWLYLLQAFEKTFDFYFFDLENSLIDLHYFNKFTSYSFKLAARRVLYELLLNIKKNNGNQTILLNANVNTINLKELLTAEEYKAVLAVKEYGTQTKAARAISKSLKTINKQIAASRAKLGKHFKTTISTAELLKMV